MKTRLTAGFTSLEFTNGLSAFTLLLTAGASGVHNFAADIERTTVTNQMLMGLKVAQSIAHQYETVVTVCPSQDGHTCGGNWSDGWVAFMDLDGDGEMDAGERGSVVARALNDPDAGITVVSDSDRLSFRRGPVMAAAETGVAATVCIRDDRGADKSRVIWIRPSGTAEVHARRPGHEIAENAARDFSHRSADCY